MKNKKGFTLIELLAIIVILAIIAVITVPLILNIINDAQKNASIDSAYGYKSALEKYYMKKVVENTENELPNGYKEISELPEDFAVSGKSPSEGWVKLKKGIVQKFSLKYNDYVVTMDNDKNVTSEKQETIDPHVPDNYQEVEYLESTGTQYIDTGISGESKWEITNQYTNPSNTSQILVGCGAAAGQWFGQYNEKYASGTTSAYIFNINSTTKQNLSINFTSTNVSAIIDNETKNRAGSLSGNKYYLFGGFISSSGSFYSYTKVYKTKAYQNNDNVRNLVPVVRKSDNKPGMLDLANLSENLFNKNKAIMNKQYGSQGQLISPQEEGTWYASDFIEVEQGKTYIRSSNGNACGNYYNTYDENKTFLGKYAPGTGVSFTINSGVKYITFAIRSDSTPLDTFQLNEGTTALPYEPYGYKFYTNAGSGDDFITGSEI